MPERVAAEKIFIIPDATLIVELLIFLVVLAVLWRFVVPPVQRAMVERRDIVRRELEEAERARGRLAEAEQEYRRAVDETRADATRVREEARAEGQRLLDAARDRAAREYEDQAAEHADRLQADRLAVLAALRDDIGALSVQLAGRVIGEPLDASANQETVERFLAGSVAGARVVAGEGSIT